jgi:hypothetical protein
MLLAMLKKKNKEEEELHVENDPWASSLLVIRY